MKRPLIYRGASGKLIFGGDLAEPIVPPVRNALFGILSGPPDPQGKTEKDATFIVGERLRKLNLLAEEVDLSRDNVDWRFVAYYLASEFVPGFAVAREGKRRVGRPRRSFTGEGSDFALQMAVETLTEGRNFGISRACELLAKRPGPWKGIPATTLETRYHKHKKTMRALYDRNSGFMRLGASFVDAPAAAKIE